MKRSDALLGRWRDPAIEWVPDQERSAFVAWVRQVEGKDCDPAGDIALYRLADGRPVYVRAIADELATTTIAQLVARAVAGADLHALA